MKKFLNSPQNYVDEMLLGIIEAHPEYEILANSNRSLLWTTSKDKHKVMIVTGGGSGHLPLFLGYIGDGLCDGVAVGNIFSSPSAQTVAATAQALEPDQGVLFVIGNYFGDQMNFEEATETLRAAGIPAEMVIVSDDVASAPPEEWQDRRGIAGLIFMYKLLGAAAEQGISLSDLKQMAERINPQLKTLGVTLSGCILPAVGKPSYTVPENMMYVGMGIHGEAGIEVVPHSTVDEMVPLMLQKLTAEFDGDTTDTKLAVLVNSLGATPLEELYIIFHSLKAHLVSSYKLEVVWVGRFATSMETVGMSITLLRLQDDWADLLQSGCYSPFFPMQLPPFQQAKEGRELN